MKKKTLALLMACMLLVGATVGGTVAWLTAQTGPVENTFTVGDINLDILESPVDENGEIIENGTPGKNNAYHFVPGDTFDKDPWVVVKAKSEPCYLFIHAVETNNSVGTVAKVIHWSVDTTKGWKPVVINGATIPNYWYQEITSMTEMDTNYSILTGNQVTVDENVTKEMVAGLKDAAPKLTFTAAAVQMDNLDFAAAWDKLPEGFK